MHIPCHCGVRSYNGPDIYVLESGWSEVGEGKRTGADRLQDPMRTQYYKGYIEAACQ
jgi:hypothetical protein